MSPVEIFTVAMLACLVDTTFEVAGTIGFKKCVRCLLGLFMAVLWPILIFVKDAE